MGITELLGSIFGGGVTGLLGAVLQRYSDYKTKQLELQMQEKNNAHEIEMKKADAEIMAQEWAGKTQVAETEAKAAESTADAQGFTAAITSEPQRYSTAATMTTGQAWLMVALDFLRGVVRPALTLYLCAITTMVYWEARALVGPNRPPISVDDAVGLLTIITSTILYLTTTCVCFWFGTRNHQSPPRLFK